MTGGDDDVDCGGGRVTNKTYKGVGLDTYLTVKVTTVNVLLPTKITRKIAIQYQ